MGDPVSMLETVEEPPGARGWFSAVVAQRGAHGPQTGVRLYDKVEAVSPMGLFLSEMIGIRAQTESLQGESD